MFHRRQHLKAPPKWERRINQSIDRNFSRLRAHRRMVEIRNLQQKTCLHQIDFILHRPPIFWPQIIQHWPPMRVENSWRIFTMPSTRGHNHRMSDTQMAHEHLLRAQLHSSSSHRAQLNDLALQYVPHLVRSKMQIRLPHRMGVLLLHRRLEPNHSPHFTTTQNLCDEITPPKNINRPNLEPNRNMRMPWRHTIICILTRH
mmetsp:Transcript_2137/g.7773  ORF Transcript_2137/g.7773 Transcript_2137/m.7773 type:complete len:201 (-) Transcript_2137:1063-1665(-)